MKHNKSKALLSIFSCFFLINANAQRATVASGGNASGSGGSVSYTVGQIDYSTNTGSTGSGMQGVQQPYEISTIGINDIVIDLNISAFPNPSNDFLTLKYENYKLENTGYQLYDSDGKLIESKMLINNQTTITMSQLIPAIYFLKVTTETKELKVFKIIKL